LDFAACLDHLANTLLPDAGKIVLVMDNLNTLKEASLFEAFPPEKACALCERFEMHWTPKHGSWLNMAVTRNRTSGADLSGPQDRLGRRIHRRSESLSRLEECGVQINQLAVHQRKSPDQTQITLSNNLNFTRH
jgi:hypothetical protein